MPKKMGPCIIGKTHRFSVPKHLQTLRKIPVYKICKSLDFFFKFTFYTASQHFWNWVCILLLQDPVEEPQKFAPYCILHSEVMFFPASGDWISPIFLFPCSRLK